MHLNHAVYQALLPSADAWGLKQGRSWESHGGESRYRSSPQTCAGVAGAAAVI